jgi:hypothetical protein
MNIEDVKTVTEAERQAAEAAIAERLGPEAPRPHEGAKSNSPYSDVVVVYPACGANGRGARIALAAVCKSYDGAGHYKNRGRWRTVYIAALKADGELAACEASDRDAQEVGFSGFYVRPWATHEAEEASRGLGLAQDAMAAAFAAVGL